MTDIFQQIWDADQSDAGVQPMLDTGDGDPTVGFVKVNTNLNAADKDLRVLPEAVIPDSKRHTYDLCHRLFDNYALPERDEEDETPEEREEVHDLVHAMVDTAPMQVAREYIAQATGASITRERWYNFWYKYYLDDGFARPVDGATANFPGLTDDRIAYLGSKQSADQAQFPESVTISYRWDAADYDREELRPLTKKIGGFFVGCSVEGLLALGSVRAHLGAPASKEAVINGTRYQLKVFRSENKRHVRTFYPVFVGAVDDGGSSGPGGGGTPVVAGHIRIIAALVNPEGHDPGKETLTLINTGTTQETLSGWLAY